MTRDGLIRALEDHAAKHGSEPHYAYALREAAALLRSDEAAIAERDEFHDALIQARDILAERDALLTERDNLRAIVLSIRGSAHVNPFSPEGQRMWAVK